MYRILIKYILLIVLVTFSCGKKNNPTNDVSEILSVLYDTLAAPIPLVSPSLPEGYTTEDSLKIADAVKDFRQEQSDRKQKVAILPYLSPGKNIDIHDLPIREDYKNLIVELKTLESQPFDLSVLKTDRNDSIIRFDKNLLDPQVSDFLKFDRFISFSRIAFNKECSIAAVIGTSSTSGLAGHSAIYFFERKNKRWHLVKSIGLWIS